MESLHSNISLILSTVLFSWITFTGTDFYGIPAIENGPINRLFDRSSRKLSLLYCTPHDLSHPGLPTSLERSESIHSSTKDCSSIDVFNSRDEMVERGSRSAFKAVRKHCLEFDRSVPCKNPSALCTTICYEMLVTALLKIFNHPCIFGLPFSERLHHSITYWPIIWTLQLGRKTNYIETKCVIENCFHPILNTHPSVLIVSLLDLIQRLQHLALDQAEIGLVETLILTKMSEKGNI